MAQVLREVEAGLLVTTREDGRLIPEIVFVQTLHRWLFQLTCSKLQLAWIRQAKDAGDVYRLFDATVVTDIAETTLTLLGDDRSAVTTQQAFVYLRALFATPRSRGIRLAAEALAGIVDEPTVARFMTGYTRDLLEQTRP